MKLSELLDRNEKIAVSGCLAGLICRYDGKYAGIKSIEDLVNSGRVLPFCPEVAGELSTPRDPAEIQGGDGADVWNGTAKVITINGATIQRWC